jgi:hypothetical protein
MGVNIKGGSNTTGLANVSTNYELQVVTPQTEINAGFVQLSTEVDSGSVVGTRTVLALESSDDYRLRVALDQTMFNASFEGTSILTTTWSQLLTTQTVAQASGFMTLNSTVPTVTSSTAAYVRTWRHFPTFGTYPTYLDMWIREANTTATNCISEWGFLYLTSQTTAQVLDGIFFRRTSGGSLYGVIVNNGTDISTTTAINVTNVPSRDGVGAFDPTETNHYLITYHNDTVRFWINDVVVAEVACPAAYAQFTSSSNSPVGFRVINTGTASATRQLSVGYVNVALGDQNVNKPWQHALAGLGAGAYQLQQGNTPGPTVTRASGAAGHPASATARIAGTWTALTAPALNNLGGLWTSPAMSTLTSDADYPVFAFLNPAGTAALPGKTLYVTGVRVGEAYVSAAASTNAMFLSYILMVGASASTTSTADAATTVSGKSITIGGHGFTSTQAVGDYKPGFEMRFDSPLMIPAGHYFIFVVRPFGTVTLNTLVVTSSLAVNGYFE